MYSVQSDSDDGQIRYYWIPNMGDAYVVGNDGSVWSRYKGRGKDCYLSNDWTRLYPLPDDGGYFRVTLYFNGVKYRKKIHQLVCEAVHGLCLAGLEVCHNDGNPANNWYWNLRYDTRINNQADRVKHGTDIRGEKSSSVLLNWTKVREIRAKWNSGKYTRRELVLEYQVSDGCIANIIYNRAWIEEEVLV